MVKALLKGVVGLALFTAAWFGLAGRLDWWQGWALLAVFTLLVVGFAGRLAASDPDLMKERSHPGGAVPAWDRWVMRAYSLFLIAQLAVSALDSGRFGWSDVAPVIQALGWAIMAIAAGTIWRVAQSNPFLSSSARLQKDRSQVVIQTGPYAHVRHPMYLAIAAIFVALPLALASLWSFIPATVNAALFVYRTYREDEMLMQGLPGYSAYAQAVRYRLVPGIW